MLSDQSRPLGDARSPTRVQNGAKRKAGPHFVVVNGRAPYGHGLCASCREPVGEAYARDIVTGQIYCTSHSMRRRSRISDLASRVRAWVLS